MFAQTAAGAARHLSERLGGGDANRRGVVEVKAAIHLGPLRDERGELLRRARVVTGDELDELAQRAEFRGCVLLEEVLQDAAEVGVELDRSVVVRSREVLRAGVSAEADAARGRRGGGGSEFGRAGRTGRRARRWAPADSGERRWRRCGGQIVRGGRAHPANAAPPPKPPAAARAEDAPAARFALSFPMIAPSLRRARGRSDPEERTRAAANVVAPVVGARRASKRERLENALRANAGDVYGAGGSHTSKGSAERALPTPPRRRSPQPSTCPPGPSPPRAFPLRSAPSPPRDATTRARAPSARIARRHPPRRVATRPHASPPPRLRPRPPPRDPRRPPARPSRRSSGNGRATRFGTRAPGRRAPP